MPEKNEKINFFKTAFKSIKDLDKYEDFALEMPSKAFKYLLKMILIFCLIISVFYTYKIVDNMTDIYANLKNKLPDFSYTQGNLTVNSEESIVIEDYKDSFGKVIIDTNVDENNIENYEQDIKKEGLGVLILKDKCIIISNGTIGQAIYKYSDLTKNYNINDFTKQDIVNYIDGINIVAGYATIYFTIFVYIFIMYFISIFIDVLILSLLAYIVSRISKIKLKFAPAFNIAIHSITLSVTLNLIYIIVNLLTGFRITYFQLMYNTISYIYVIVGILMIKTDFINRQIELIKIAKEQEKVKEEMDKKEEKEPEKRENKEEKKKDSPETKDKNEDEDGKESCPEPAKHKKEEKSKKDKIEFPKTTEQ